MTPQQLINIARDRPLMVVVCDGMHELPVSSLGNVTPWQAANCRYMSTMRRDDICLIPHGMEASTDVAMFTLLGYDVSAMDCCRAPLEALGLGIEVLPQDMVLRCNLVSVHDGVITSHCGGGVGHDDARAIVELLNGRYADEQMCFYAGDGFRALLKVRSGGALPHSTAPHDILGVPYKPFMIGDEKLSRLNIAANKLLGDAGFKANGIWLWSAGRLGNLRQLDMDAASISGTQMIRGLSKAVGMDVVEVKGADGTLDTNLTGKASAAVDAMGNHRMVMVHVEACDEASHRRDVNAKVKMIERIDSELIAPLMRFARNNDVALAVLSDHATSSLTGHHLTMPVPLYLL